MPESETEMDDNSNYKRSESECESSEKKFSSHHFFRHLRFLNLNYTLLESWDDIDRLGKFPALHCLRLQGCPLFEVSLVLSYIIFFISNEMKFNPSFYLFVLDFSVYRTRTTPTPNSKTGKCSNLKRGRDHHFG